MRIIAGACRRKPLNSVPGMETRPTSDRIRESIFNILRDMVREAVVLDLFAGTGALGLEALSRGAKQALFIDRAPAAIKTIKRNIAGCGVEDRATVKKWDVVRDLNCLKNQAPPFSLVFIDPPYGKGWIRPALQHLAAASCLAPEAVLVIEHTSDEREWKEIPYFFPHDQRKYSKTLVSFVMYSI
ncbi:MAG: 16S rRNA (guanine(966)-N(2))-methyltransferase RsmD [Deltaproteobacteria bacterium]|nr:MAG: 16S rRNA (guanine(966)-N(2))-methyltransferase RsmD [Deltaproteobacteria bacterium]